MFPVVAAIGCIATVAGLLYLAIPIINPLAMAIVIALFLVILALLYTGRALSDPDPIFRTEYRFYAVVAWLLLAPVVIISLVLL